MQKTQKINYLKENTYFALYGLMIAQGYDLVIEKEIKHILERPEIYKGQHIEKFIGFLETKQETTNDLSSVGLISRYNIAVAPMYEEKDKWHCVVHHHNLKYNDEGEYIVGSGGRISLEPNQYNRKTLEEAIIKVALHSQLDTWEIEVPDNVYNLLKNAEYR